MNRLIGIAALAAMLAVAVPSSLRAADEDAPQKKHGKKGKGKGKGKDRSGKPVYLDKEHAPKGKGWVKLFNGADLSGWKAIPEGPASSWKVEDGVMVNDFKAGEHGTNLVSDEKFEDFEIYYEYMVVKDGNSGVFLRGQYEIQIQDDKGQPVDHPKDWGNGGIYGQKAPMVNASKAAGEWQSGYARIVGKKITVFINGEKVVDGFEPPRPTFVYPELKLNGEQPSGPILVQGDHRPVKFRVVMVKPIAK